MIEENERSHFVSKMKDQSGLPIWDKMITIRKPKVADKGESGESHDEYDSKISGSSFRKIDDKYSLIYIDSDLCNTSGNIVINFTDSSKTKLNWKYSKDENWIDSSCPYNNSNPFPDPLPKEIVLIKQ